MRHKHPTFIRNIWISRPYCSCPLIIWTEEEYNKNNYTPDDPTYWTDYYHPDERINYISGYKLGECRECGPVTYDERFIKTTLSNEQIQKIYKKL